MSLHIESSNVVEASDKINATIGDLPEESRIQESQVAITDKPSEEADSWIVIIVVIGALIFGAKKIPDLRHHLQSSSDTTVSYRRMSR